MKRGTSSRPVGRKNRHSAPRLTRLWVDYEHYQIGRTTKGRSTTSQSISPRRHSTITPNILSLSSPQPTKMLRCGDLHIYASWGFSNVVSVVATNCASQNTLVPMPRYI